MSGELMLIHVLANTFHVVEGELNVTRHGDIHVLTMHADVAMSEFVCDFSCGTWNTSMSGEAFD